MPAYQKFPIRIVYENQYTRPPVKNLKKVMKYDII